jgi:hypothetical protein
MAALTTVKSQSILLLEKEIMVVKNTPTYTWNWYRHLVGDRA